MSKKIVSTVCSYICDYTWRKLWSCRMTDNFLFRYVVQEYQTSYWKLYKWMLDFQIHRCSSTNPLARWATSAWCHLRKAGNAKCQMFNDSIWFWQSDSNKIGINTFEFQKNILQHLWFCHNLWPPVDDAHSAPLVDSIVHAAMKRPGARQFGRQRQRWISIH